MNQIPENIEELSPYTLLRNFSRNRLVPCLFLALVVHVAVIGGLSSNYIYRTWIEPAAQAPSEAAAQPDSSAAPSAAQGAEGQSGEEAPATREEAAEAGEKDPAQDGGNDSPDAPVVDRVTGQADPKELPSEPAGLGISIDDIEE
jgi:hypothetical protein